MFIGELQTAPELFLLNSLINCVCGSTMTNMTSDTARCEHFGCARYHVVYERPQIPLQRARVPRPSTPPVSPPSVSLAPGCDTTVPLGFLRQTGRTYRMLQHAVQLVDQGIPVTIVVLDSVQVRHMRSKIDHEFPRLSGEVRIINLATEPRFELETLHITGVDARGVLFDHYVLERRAEKLLAALHYFDPPVPRPPQSW